LASLHSRYRRIFAGWLGRPNIDWRSTVVVGGLLASNFGWRRRVRRHSVIGQQHRSQRVTVAYVHGAERDGPRSLDRYSLV
jgi:hypothetical protein